jgi:tripartite-type tricarboxylate transporter receptor subunit TctC
MTDLRLSVGCTLRTLMVAVALVVTSQAADLPPLLTGSGRGFPAKPLLLITGSAPGGGSDFVARTLAEKLSERFGQPVLVDNRPGAGGSVGADVVAKANADGYTLLLNTGSGIAVNPALQTLPYDVKRDFAPVLQVSRAPFVLATNPALPAKTVADVIQLAKAHPARYSYASSGIGSMSHLAMELFKSMAVVNVVHVPYRGSAPAAVDLIAGQVQLAMNNIMPTLPHVKSGRLRALGVSWPVALSGVAGGADSGRKRPTGVRGHAMVWRVAAGESAQAHRGVAASGNHQRDADSGRARAFDGGGRRYRRWYAGTVCCLYCC